MIVIEILLAIIAILAAACAYFLKDILGDVKKIKNELKPLTPAIVEIQGKFTEQGHPLLFPLTVTPGSPLKLTDYGTKLMNDSGFAKTIANETNKKTLVDVVKAMNPQTEYDIQECSIKTIQNLLDKNNPMLNSLKDYAFKNGLPLSVLIKPAGVLLRDEALKAIKV